MNNSLIYTPQEEAYINLYSGKTILLRVSGSVIETAGFQKDAETVMALIKEGVRFILSVGGGPQIDQAYSKAKVKPSKKINGVRPTSHEAMNKALIPAAKHIRTLLNDVFHSTDVHHHNPDDIKCDYLDFDRYGFVGKPNHIDNLDPSIPLNIFQFIGLGPSELVNVNADHMMKTILETHGRINELIMLSDSNGIWGEDKKPIPVIDTQTLRSLIDDGTITDGMLNKAELILQMMPLASKGVILGSGNLREELLGWKGSGTMVIDMFKHEHPMVKPEEYPIIEAVFKDLMSEGPFRPRESKEIEEAIAYHHLMKIKNSMLGGVSLIPRENDWTELGLYWAGIKSNGFGRMILENAKAHANALKQKTMAITSIDGAASTFSHAGFSTVGPIDQIKNDSGMPNFIKNYPGNPEGKVALMYDGTKSL